MQPVGDEITAPELIRSHRNVAEKRLIAQVAYDMINEKDTLFMDGSSTVNELAKLIARADRKRLYVITPSLTTVSALADCASVSVLMVGGEVNYRLGHVEGTLATEAIRNMRADKCFIGINGIDQSFGKGECVAVIGPSGSGKSTFLRCLNLLETGGDRPEVRHDAVLEAVHRAGGSHQVRARVHGAAQPELRLRDHRYAHTGLRLPMADGQLHRAVCG